MDLTWLQYIIPHILSSKPQMHFACFLLQSPIGSVIKVLQMPALSGSLQCLQGMQILLSSHSNQESCWQGQDRPDCQQEHDVKCLQGTSASLGSGAGETDAESSPHWVAIHNIGNCFMLVQS